MVFNWINIAFIFFTSLIYCLFIDHNISDPKNRILLKWGGAIAIGVFYAMIGVVAFDVGGAA